MRAVDTNILIYAHDPRDASKQQIAIDLIQSLMDGVLLWQVACEYLSASHKLAPLGYSREDAWHLIFEGKRSNRAGFYSNKGFFKPLTAIFSHFWGLIGSNRVCVR